MGPRAATLPWREGVRARGRRAPPPLTEHVESYSGLELVSDPVERGDERDFVGIGPSSKTLAKLTIRRHVGTALDLGTGTGIHALLAARHADRVVGVDVSERALDFARRNAERNGVANVEWRQGSWLEPVRGDRYDLVVANPPYVISPENTLVYRDSGEPGDALVRRLLTALPDVLAEGGFAQVLCNWVDGLDDVVHGRGCDALILRSKVFTPDEYARLWSTDRGEIERWVGHYRKLGIAAITAGLVTLRRRSSANWTRALAVPALPTDGAGEHLERLFTGWDWVLAGGRGPARPVARTRIVRRLDLDDGGERITLEVRPNVGFAARISAAVADALARGESLQEGEKRRLVGLGLLVPA